MGWTDLHIHSNFSDGKLSIPQIIALYGQRGFSCIAITDHLCEEKTLREEAARALRQYKMLGKHSSIQKDILRPSFVRFAIRRFSLNSFQTPPKSNQ